MRVPIAFEPLEQTSGWAAAIKIAIWSRACLRRTKALGSLLCEHFVTTSIISHNNGPPSVQAIKSPRRWHARARSIASL